MNKKRALMLLVLAARKYMQPLAYDANMYMLGERGPHFEHAHKDYQTMAEAIAWAEAELKQRSLFDG